MKINTCYRYLPLVLLLSANNNTSTMEQLNPVNTVAIPHTLENSDPITPATTNIGSLSLDDAHIGLPTHQRFHLQFLTHIDELTLLVGDSAELVRIFSNGPSKSETLQRLEAMSKKLNSKTNLLEVLCQQEDFDSSIYKKSGARQRLKTTYSLFTKSSETPHIQEKVVEVSTAPHNPAYKLCLSLLAVEKFIEKE